MSNTALADRVGVSREMIRQYKEGATPGADKLPALAKALEVSQQYLTRLLTSSGKPPAGPAFQPGPMPVYPVDDTGPPMVAEFTPAGGEDLTVVSVRRAYEIRDEEGVLLAVDMVIRARAEPLRQQTSPPAEMKKTSAG